MAIFESKKQTDIEKRLKLLHQQLYGKKNSNEVRITQKSSSSEYQIGQKSSTTNSGRPVFSSSSKAFGSDLTYLYQDLFKIGIFATLALGIQIILLILTKNHILNLNFF